MAITPIAHVAGAGANTFTTGSINTTGANLLTIVLTENTPGGAAISDSKVNSWTICTEQSNSINPACTIYYCNAPSVGTLHTFTATGSSIFAVISADAWAGADTVSPLGQQNGTGGGAFTNTAAPGSITPALDNELVISGFAWNASMVITSVTGCTILDQTNFSAGVNYGGGAAYAIQTTAIAINPAWNFTGTLAGNVVVASFKVSSGAVPLPPGLGPVVGMPEWAFLDSAMLR